MENMHVGNDWYCDELNQEKFLIHGIEVRVRLVRSRDSFFFMDALLGV